MVKMEFPILWTADNWILHDRKSVYASEIKEDRYGRIPEKCGINDVSLYCRKEEMKKYRTKCEKYQIEHKEE